MNSSPLAIATELPDLRSLLPEAFQQDPIPPDSEGRYSRRACRAPGCIRISTAKTDLCRPHHEAFRDGSTPSLEEWLDLDRPPSPIHRDGRASHGYFDVAQAGNPVLRDELAFGIYKRGERSQPTAPTVANSLASALASRPTLGTLLALRYDADAINSLANDCGSYADRVRAFLLDTLDELCKQIGVEPTRRYLGVASAGRGAFTNLNLIQNEEFRGAVIRWMEYRLAAEQGSPQYIQSILKHLQDFCIWLSEQGVTSWPELTRAHMLTYLHHVNSAKMPNGNPYSKKTRLLAISAIAVFIDEASLNEWAAIPRQARWMRNERPKTDEPAPRLMGRTAARQLRTPDVLALVKDPDTRLVIRVMAETGLRRKDVCHGMSMECILDLGDDRWSLRYLNSKSKKTETIPIKPELAEAIRIHRSYKKDKFPGTNNLFARDETDRIITLTLVNRDLTRLIEMLDLRAADGTLLRVTPHMFRHQNATEWLENGMPITAIQRLLGHSSLRTTEGYARINEAKVREQWEKSLAVNSEGELVQTPGSEVSEAAWLHAFAGGASQSLPNGRCGMPCSETCEHANACLYCPLFITTPEYLPVLREQQEDHKRIIDMATEQGYVRIVEKNQKPFIALTTLIKRLEKHTRELVDIPGAPRE